MIFDAHRHLVKNKGEKDFSLARKRYFADLKINNILESIVIADNVADSDTANTKTLIDIFKNDLNVKIIGSINPFSDLVEQEREFDKYLTDKHIIGLKLFNGFDKIYPIDKECFTSYQLAEKHNAPVVFHTGINENDIESAKYNDPKYIVEIAKQFLKLKIIISHFYWPKIEYCLNTVQDIPNIYLDTTVLADDCMSKYMKRDQILNILTRAVKAKPESIIFGSDYPSCETNIAIELIGDLNISTEEKDRIFYKNHRKLFF